MAASNVPWQIAVAQDRDSVGDAQDLRQPVAHVHDPDARTAPLDDEGVEALDVLQPERRRRLVEEQHLRLGEQRLDDLEELPLRERERSGGSFGGMPSPNAARCAAAHSSMRPNVGRSSAGAAR